MLETFVSTPSHLLLCAYQLITVQGGISNIKINQGELCAHTAPERQRRGERSMMSVVADIGISVHGCFASGLSSSGGDIPGYRPIASRVIPIVLRSRSV